MKGFFGKILVIDLTEQTFHEECVPDSVYRKYLGGKGLGTHLLLKMNEPKVDPFSAGNHLIFALGPMTGTRIWGSSRYGVYTKSPLTGIYAEAYSGGQVAESMSHAGYDAFVLRGISPALTVLEISDREVRFHDARDIAGKDCYETQDLIAGRIGVDSGTMLVIGPAGEELVRFAIIANNYWRCAGRTGVGAVMGSKRVKGIVFHGSRKRETAHPGEVEEFIREWGRKSKDLPARKPSQIPGAPGMEPPLPGVFPSRYWREGGMDGRNSLRAETPDARRSVTPQGCTNCFLPRGKLTTLREGEYKGLKLEGPSHGTLHAFSGLCLIQNVDEVLYLNDLCNRLGVDTISAGNLAGFTIEAARRGAIREKLEYGDVEGVAGLIRKIARAEGIGALLARGIRPAAKEWGLEDLAIHVKGMEPGGYDPRVLKSMALAYATSDRGACHTRSTAFNAELAGLDPPDQIEGKARVFIDFEDRLTLMDTLIGCHFYNDLYQWEDLGRIIRITTDLEFDQDGLRRLASDIRNAVRFFNIKEGMQPARDDMLPNRFFDEGIGKDKRVITREEFASLLKDYYRLRGWNEEGVPKKPLD